MKRAVVFAHFDKDSLIDDYVIYYLKALKNCVEKVIFVSCNTITETEKNKIKDYTDTIIAEPHKEYDFGSYKRGFEILRKEGLSNYEEIIFANDSCYGPLFPLENVFETMEEKDCDFWGITKNFYGIGSKTSHIQSYFIAFRKKTFMSGEFLNFIENIKEEKSKNDVIKNYEIGLSKLLYTSNFKDAVYTNEYKNINNPSIKKWKQLILKYHSPLVKCNILRMECTSYTTIENWQKIIKTTDYPIELIEKNLERTKNKTNRELKLPLFIKELLFNYILLNSPNAVRHTVIKILQKVF